MAKKKTLGEKISAYLARHGLTQADLAAAAHLNPSVVHRARTRPDNRTTMGHARRLIKASGGELTWEDFCPADPDLRKVRVAHERGAG